MINGAAAATGCLANQKRPAPVGGRGQLLVSGVVAIGVGLICCLAALQSNPRSRPLAAASEHALQAPPSSWQQLLSKSPTEIAGLDIALLNLLCADGLPGAEGLAPQTCIGTLNQWAQPVQSETERHLHRFKEDPAEFDHSEGYFRMLMMAVVLYEDFSVRYNPERISAPGAVDPNDHFFADSRDIFLHGLLLPSINPQLSTLNRRTGTCSSLPVLYIAIGRRLGYPLKLVTTKAHLFIRWESATEQFDLEATGKGMNRYDDEHFRHWPFAVSEEEIKADGYLKSLTPVEELAVFLSLRGHCLREAGRIQEAASAYRAAADLAPASRAYRLLLAETLAGSAASFPAAASRQTPSFGSGLPPEVLNSEAPSGRGRNPNPPVDSD
jgi:hypothetical protein